MEKPIKQGAEFFNREILRKIYLFVIYVERNQNYIIVKLFCTVFLSELFYTIIIYHGGHIFERIDRALNDDHWQLFFMDASIVKVCHN